METSGVGQARYPPQTASPIATTGDSIWAAETFGWALPGSSDLVQLLGTWQWCRSLFSSSHLIPSQKLLCCQQLAFPEITGNLGVGFQEHSQQEGPHQHGARGTLASLWLELLQQCRVGVGWAQLTSVLPEPVPADLKLTFYSKHGVFFEEENEERGMWSANAFIENSRVSLAQALLNLNIVTVIKWQNPVLAMLIFWGFFGFFLSLCPDIINPHYKV